MNRALPYGLVGLQFALLIALALAPASDLWVVGTAVLVLGLLLLAAGAAVAIGGVLGLGASLTASPVPKSQAALVTGGLYGFVRHPIYTGLLLGGLGLTAIKASWWHIALWLALLVLLSAKARWEERMLVRAHPDYLEYGARTGRFIPGLGRLH